MLSSTQQFVTTMDAKGVKYTYQGTTESGKDRLVLRYSGDNVSSMTLQFFFDADCESVAIRVFDLVKFPAEKLNNMYAAVNAVNNRFRFAKFCIDTSDNTIQAELDTPFRSYDVGEICMELTARTVDICDKAYPDLMKAIWA